MAHSPATKDLLASLAHTAALPLEQATAMQPGLYRSEEILAVEHREIFAKEWLCPGRTADIPKPGDYITFTIGDQPVMITRTSSGEIRAQANVCLHRMMQLLEGKGNCKRIVCPYHAWTYDLDGRLIGAPHMDRSTGFKPREHRLPEVRCEVWEGWIYVTLNADAPPVATMLASLGDVTSRYRQEHYVPVATEDYVWQTNWKLLTENFMEGYHLPVAHKATVGAWFPAEETGFPPERHDHFTYQTFTKTADATYGLAHKDNTVLTGPWRNTSVMPTVFPTHMYVLAPDHLWYLSLRPRGLGEVDVRFGAALAPERLAALDDPAKFVADTIAFFDKVNAEDKGVVMGIYQGAKAPLSRPGRLSWLEREIHDFIGYLARRLAPAELKALKAGKKIAAE
jgi:phenylpropionate dioxygenase-like ring-hydroxylating dioxygenase large terminal subunit